MNPTSRLFLVARRVAELAVLGTMAGAGFGVVAHVARADADGNPATDGVARVFAYEGRLEFDGSPFNGTAAVGFSVYDGAASATPVWTETQTITVYNGSFSALLGVTTPLGNLAARADDLYVGITVDGVALAGRQRLVPAPYSLWTTAATNLSVGQDATIARDLFVSRNASVTGSLTVSGGVTLPTGSITSAFVADNALTANDLAPDSVGSSEIAADAVGASEMANNAVGSAEIIDGSISTDDILNGTVASIDILDETIGSADITDGGVERADIAGSEVIVYRGNNTVCGESSGDLFLGSSCPSELCASGISPRWYTCAGSCSGFAPTTCTRPTLGYLLAP